LFETKQIEELPDGSKHIQNIHGVIELHKPGIVSIATEIRHTLTDRESWEKEFLPRLKFSEDRYDFKRLKELASSAKSPLGIECGSILGIIRNWFGIVGMSYVAVEDEELYNEVICTVGELAYDVVKYGLETADSLGIRFDFGHFWEDMCYKNGSLINPAVFSDKAGPYYKKITDLGKDYGIKVFSVDCDGLVDQLVPIWLENGINTMFPIEVGTWGASIKSWREKYGDAVLGIGGMDKRVFAQDRKAVDAEIERLKSPVELGGYTPCPDHRIAPDAEWDNVRYYCDRMREAF
jgi:uroporphyrinogen decarboxylase